jgi:hypothetical protein
MFCLLYLGTGVLVLVLEASIMLHHSGPDRKHVQIALAEQGSHLLQVISHSVHRYHASGSPVLTHARASHMGSLASLRKVSHILFLIQIRRAARVSRWKGWGGARRLK